MDKIDRISVEVVNLASAVESLTAKVEKALQQQDFILYWLSEHVQHSRGFMFRSQNVSGEDAIPYKTAFRRMIGDTGAIKRGKIAAERMKSQYILDAKERVLKFRGNEAEQATKDKIAAAERKLAVLKGTNMEED